MVDIEKIMQEIREEIKEKGLKKEILSFEECPIPGAVSKVDIPIEDFDLEFYIDSINKMNYTYFIKLDRALTGNPVAKFIKKLVRKFIKYYIAPIVSDQTEFNAYSVRSANSVRNYIRQAEEDKKHLKVMEKRIEALEAALLKK